MHITLIGMILIPILIFSFMFLKKEYIFCMMVVFSSFTSTSVININSLGNSIMIYHIIGIMFIIRILIDYIIKYKYVKKIKINKCLSIFLILTAISLTYPIIISSGVIVLTPDNKYLPLEFSTQNITQYLYLLFGFMVYASTLYFFKNYKFSFENFFKLLKITCLIVLVLGIVQYFVPSQLFDNIFRTDFHHNMQTLEGKTRISSVNIEASILSLFIAPVTVICIINVFKNKSLLDLLIIMCSFAISLLNNSSSFFLGILSFLIYNLIFLLIKSLRIRVVRFKLSNIIFMFSTVILIGIFLFIFRDKIYSSLGNLLYKLSGNGVSGKERDYTFTYHIDIFKQYFITGVGFGSIRTKDLLSTWLSELGLLGFTPFIIYICSRIILLIKCKSKDADYMIGIILTTIVILLVSVPEPYYLYIWIYFTAADYLIYENLINKIYNNEVSNKNVNINSKSLIF